jgi:hypothetical protein
MADKIKPVCPYCGSAEVSQDTSAIWDVEAQAYASGDPYDKSGSCGACNACDFHPDWVPAGADAAGGGEVKARACAADLAAQEVADSPAVLGVYAAPAWDELHDDGKAWVKAIVEEARRPLLAFAQIVASYPIDGPDICQGDVQDTFREVIASARHLTGAHDYKPMAYQAEIEDSLPRETPVNGCGCDWPGTLGQVEPIRDCCLTPGDPSPAGRCPQCLGLVYVDTENTRLMDAAPDLLAALEGLLAFAEAAETKILVGDEGCLWPVEEARAAIAKAKGGAA